MICRSALSTFSRFTRTEVPSPACSSVGPGSDILRLTRLVPRAGSSVTARSSSVYEPETGRLLPDRCLTDR
jgi:hypothetical protein